MDDELVERGGQRMDYLDLGIHISNLKSVLARSACRMQMQ